MEKVKKVLKEVIPVRLWDAGHILFSLSAALGYWFPSRDITVVGVTGTNGKSTVIELLHQIFSDFGFRVASLSSLRAKIRDEVSPSRPKTTMPGRWALQKFLSVARKAGCQFAIVEVTSEGIKQYRHIGVIFRSAVITNLRPEHIEAHGSFEAYREAKGKLFKKLARRSPGLKNLSVINLDDPSAFYFAHFEADEKVGYGLFKENSRPGLRAVIPEDIRFSADGIAFSYGGLEFSSPLVGDFNLYNVLAALATAVAFKLPLEGVREAIKKIKSVPGRIELVQKEPFRVVVDYAHTPDALEAVFRLVRSFWVPSDKKLIVVFGSAGGGRDKWKRTEMGRIADRFANHIILTNEDPYEEDPEVILREIETGISSTKHELILDRRAAIQRALEMAETGDVVVITGKGAEQVMATAEGLVPWDDRAVVKEELSRIKNNAQQSQK